MKILVIGGNGTIGSYVVKRLRQNHDVLIAGRSAGDYQIDMTKEESIHATLEKIGKLDALICIAGEARWDDFADLSEEDYYIGLKSKLMGQVNLIRIGKDFMNPGGSITLSTGILADDPVPKTTSAAMVNGALHSFVKAVDLEIGNGIRVNAVSLGLVEAAYEKYKDYFPGHNPIPMDKAVNAYVKSVEGKSGGQVIRYYDNQ